MRIYALSFTGFSEWVLEFNVGQAQRLSSNLINAHAIGLTSIKIKLKNLFLDAPQTTMLGTCHADDERQDSRRHCGSTRHRSNAPAPTFSPAMALRHRGMARLDVRRAGHALVHAGGGAVCCTTPRG